MNAGDVVTAITEASTTVAALRIAQETPPRVVALVADQLYIDPEGHGVAYLRRAIVAEARS